MPPPTWLPTPSMLGVTVPGTTPSTSSSEGGQITGEGERPKLNTPLAGMLPPELANVDVTKLFPEFRPGKVKR